MSSECSSIHQLDDHDEKSISTRLSSDNSTTTTTLQPFDWITSASSLRSILDPIFTLATTRTNSTTIEEGRSSNSSFCNNSNNQNEYHILHVGCGSSVLGEYLIEEYYNKPITKIVNVDCDTNTLQRMKQRWELKVQSQQQLQTTTTTSSSTCYDNTAMEFVTVDFTQPNSLQHYMNNTTNTNMTTFDLIIDKSTLDCMLCTDTGTTGLITEIYQYLKHDNGIYLVISFHPPDFIVPLLQHIPGTNWDVSYTIIPRQIEQYNNVNNSRTAEVDTSINTAETVLLSNDIDSGSTSTNQTYTWSSGTFRPDEQYLKNVTVVQCVRRHNTTDNNNATTNTNPLDWDQVYDHVQRVNNQWYQQMNPMLTKDRVKAIEDAFYVIKDSEEHDNNNSKITTKTKTKTKTRPIIELSLQQCYTILFTDGERENLSYDDFLDDWKIFHSKYDTTNNTCANSRNEINQQQETIPLDRMSYRTAIAFLHVMQ